MNKINAYTIQEKIRNMEFLNVAWIQNEYKLTYKEAKEFLDILIKRQWVMPFMDGACFCVIKSNLCLRKIGRDEIDALIEDLSYECISVFTCLQSKSANRALYSEISATIHNDYEAKCALKTLEKHKLVHAVDKMYYATISDQTIEVLRSMVMGKRTLLAKIKAGATDEAVAEEKSRIKGLFDKLFED